MKARMHPPSVMAPPAVDYIAMPGAPGKYFRCDRYSAVMSEASCGQSFRAAPAESQGGRLLGCIGCSIGALHAGVPLTLPACPKPTPRVCVRCRRTASAYGTQSNGWVRLVQQRTLCVSCFNREREVAVGRNAKGTKPIKAGRPYPVCVGLLAGGKVFAVYLRGVTNLSFEAEGLIDRLWSGPPIEEISFRAPAAWWEALARKAERPQHVLSRMLVDERPATAWPPNERVERFQAPQWIRRA